MLFFIVLGGFSGVTLYGSSSARPMPLHPGPLVAKKRASKFETLFTPTANLAYLPLNYYMKKERIRICMLNNLFRCFNFYTQIYAGIHPMVSLVSKTLHTQTQINYHKYLIISILIFLELHIFNSKSFLKNQPNTNKSIIVFYFRRTELRPKGGVSSRVQLKNKY